jgi:hypothetical protein
MAETPPIRPEPPTERRGGYPANGAKVGELPKPPKQATVSPTPEPPGHADDTQAASQES